MARITVEDCIDKVRNRFELVILAAKRAHQLELGATARVEWDNDKPTVVALREIAAQKTTEANVDQIETAEVTEIIAAGQPFAGDESEAV